MTAVVVVAVVVVVVVDEEEMLLTDAALGDDIAMLVVGVFPEGVDGDAQPELLLSTLSTTRGDGKRRSLVASPLVTFEDNVDVDFDVDVGVAPFDWCLRA